MGSRNVTWRDVTAEPRATRGIRRSRHDHAKTSIMYSPSVHSIKTYKEAGSTSIINVWWVLGLRINWTDLSTTTTVYLFTGILWKITFESYLTILQSIMRVRYLWLHPCCSSLTSLLIFNLSQLKFPVNNVWEYKGTQKYNFMVIVWTLWS